MNMELNFKESCGELLASVEDRFIANDERIPITINGITHTYAIKYHDAGTMAYARPSMAVNGMATNVSIDWTNKEEIENSFPILRFLGNVNEKEDTSMLTFWRNK